MCACWRIHSWLHGLTCIPDSHVVGTRWQDTDGGVSHTAAFAVISQEQVFLGKPWLYPYLGEHRTLEQQPLRNDSCLPAFSRISRVGGRGIYPCLIMY